MQRAFASPAAHAPFRLSIDPDQAFPHGGWRRARDETLTAVLGRPGLIFVLGDPGTGKSLLLTALAHALDARRLPVLQLRRGDMPADLGGNAILLIDEGDRLDEAALERIVAHARTSPCVIAGAPGLPVRFGAASLEARTILLLPMPPDEVVRFVADRLARAGHRADLFTDDAVAALTIHARGIPRILATLASSAWFLAGASPDAPVTGEHVAQAVTLRDGVAPMPAIPVAQKGAPETPVGSSPPPPQPSPIKPEEDDVGALDPSPPLAAGGPEAGAPPPSASLPEDLLPLAATAGEHVAQAATLRDGVAPMPAVPVAQKGAPETPVGSSPPPRPSPIEEEEGEEEDDVGALDSSPPPLAAGGPEAGVPPPSASLPEDLPPLAATAAMPDITAPGVPPRKRVSSLASRPFRFATALTTLAVIGLAAFLDRAPSEDRSAVPPAADTDATAPAPPAGDAAPARAEDSSRVPAADAVVNAAPTKAEGSSSPPARDAALPAPEPVRPTRVVLHYRRGDTHGARQAALLASRLRDIGLQVENPLPDGQRIARPRLQYFFAEDRDAAAAIAAYLGPKFGSERLGKPVSADSSLRPGTVAIWIPPARSPPRRLPREEGDDESE